MLLCFFFFLSLFLFSSFSPHTQLPDTNKLITAEEMVMLKRRILSLKRTGLPPIVTHNMIDDANDVILNHLRRLQMFNTPEDRVKVVFHPEFICTYLASQIFDCQLSTFSVFMHSQNCILYRLHSCQQPPVWHRVRSVCARLPSGHLPLVLRAMGLYPCRMHRHGVISNTQLNLTQPCNLLARFCACNKTPHQRGTAALPLLLLSHEKSASHFTPF